jgi:hypothetical protein
MLCMWWYKFWDCVAGDFLTYLILTLSCRWIDKTIVLALQLKYNARVRDLWDERVSVTSRRQHHEVQGPMGDAGLHHQHQEAQGRDPVIPRYWWTRSSVAASLAVRSELQLIHPTAFTSVVQSTLCNRWSCFGHERLIELSMMAKLWQTILLNSAFNAPLPCSGAIPYPQAYHFHCSHSLFTV